MHALYVVLYIIAAACFVLAALGVSARVNLLAVGLLAWVCVPLIGLLA